MMRGVSDPEETAPFTHQPYGKGADPSPFVSPSGPPGEPSGPGYVTPAPPPPPMAGPVPYGQPPGPGYQPGYQPGFPPGWAPAYGLPYAGSLKHSGANTSLVLGIISIASVVLALTCCLITIPGVFCAPFAWVVGARAKREIERQPGVYGNLSSAQTGMWMGIVMTLIGAVVLAGFVALAVWVGYNDPTLG